MVRNAALLVACLAACACDGGVRKCKEGSVLVHLSVQAGVGADALDLALSLDGAAARHQTIMHGASGTIEIDFATGYPVGSSLVVTATATAQGVPVAAGQGMVTLVRGCSSLTIAINGGADFGGPPGDLGSVDFARADLTGADLSGVKIVGNACSPGDSCLGSTCVDGYCCDQPCNGQCEACDVTPGTCTPVPAGTAPHAGHGACTGDTSGACAATCNGANRAACAYPTGQCGASSCTGGVVTLAGTCGGGSCQASSQTHTCTFGCQDANVCAGVKSFAAGYTFACAVISNGAVKCWGDNQYGEQNSTPSSATVLKPTTISAGFFNSPIGVAATFGSVCVLNGDHTVACWGDNSAAQLGTGATGASNPTPTEVPGLNDATYIAGASGGVFCAIVTNGQLECWGSNATGQIGAGIPADADSFLGPTLVCTPGSSMTPCTPVSGVLDVHGGDDYTCFVAGDNTVACSGANSGGQLGFTPDSNKYSFPKQVGGVSGATRITAGNALTCAAAGGLDQCWGNNGGRIGNNTSTPDPSPTPTSVCASADCSTLLMGVTSVSTLDESVCAAAAGGVRCWGDNSLGQVGDGSTQPEAYAATQALASGVIEVISGGGFNCAIVDSGWEHNLKCWGSDSSGELGDNGAAGATSKTPVTPAW